MKKPALKRLFLDLETSPLTVYTWRIGYKIQLSHENIIRERSIICAGYKWEHEKAAKSIEWDMSMNDRPILEELLPIVNEADEIVMHNGDRFDLPWIKTRCIFHGLPMYPDYKTIDTLAWAKRNFLFNSNRLDYISKFLGAEGKLKTEYALWKRIYGQNDRNALAYMAKYCRRDVIELEKVYQKLAAYVNPKSHVGVMAKHDNWTCPHCGSEKVHANGTRVTAAGTVRHRMICDKCKRYSSIDDAAFARYEKAKE